MTYVTSNLIRRVLSSDETSSSSEVSSSEKYQTRVENLINDDARGFFGRMGIIDYANKEVTLRFVDKTAAADS